MKLIQKFKNKITFQLAQDVFQQSNLKLIILSLLVLFAGNPAITPEKSVEVRSNCLYYDITNSIEGIQMPSNNLPNKQSNQNGKILNQQIVLSITSPNHHRPTSFKLQAYPLQKTRILDTFAGQKSVFVLINNGDLYSFGEGSYGELGHGQSIYRLTEPTKLEGRWQNLQKISAGSMHSIAVTNDGTVFAWGNGKFGALGTGDNANVLTPQFVKTN